MFLQNSSLASKNLATTPPSQKKTLVLNQLVVCVCLYVKKSNQVFSAYFPTVSHSFLIWSHLH